MAAEWRQGNNEVPQNISKLFRDATLADAWIYHEPTEKWYTPHEFLAAYNQIYSNSRRRGDNIDEFKIISPIAGERAYKKRMRDAMAEYLNFRNKVEEYFQLELKKKK